MHQLFEGGHFSNLPGSRVFPRVSTDMAAKLLNQLEHLGRLLFSWCRPALGVNLPYTSTSKHIYAL